MKQYTFGVSQYTTTPWPFERDLERYPEHGVDAIEVCEFKLNRNDYAPQLEAIAATGLTVSSVQTTIHSVFVDSLVNSPTAPEDRMRHIMSGIDRIAPHVPQGTPFVCVTGAPPDGDSARVYEYVTGAFATLADHARKHGMRIAFEALNPVLYNTDTALWGLDAALELVRTVDHEAFGLCLDSWNVFQTPNLEAVIADAAEKIFLVQLGDWHRPRSTADRVSLGKGSIDTTRIVRAIRATGYGKPYVVELFSGESLPGSLWMGDLDATLAENAAAFATIWEASS